MALSSMLKCQESVIQTKPTIQQWQLLTPDILLQNPPLLYTGNMATWQQVLIESDILCKSRVAANGQIACNFDPEFSCVHESYGD